MAAILNIVMDNDNDSEKQIKSVQRITKKGEKNGKDSFRCHSGRSLFSDDTFRKTFNCILYIDYISGVILHVDLIDFKLAPMLSDKGRYDLLPRMQAARVAGARFSK